jgi:hypothetical protein
MADSSYGLYQGQLFLRERAFNGAPLAAGYEFVGDCDMFSIDPKQKYEDIQESQSGLGLTAAHIPTETSVTVKFRALDVKMANWVRATWGGLVAGQEAGGTVATEDIVLYNGMSAPLARSGVSGVTVAGATVGTDYALDANGGSITVLSTSSAIPAGTPLTTTVSYTYAASSGTVQAFVTGQRYYSILLKGRNAAQGNQPLTVICNQATFDMAKVLNLIGKKRFEMEMDGVLLQDLLIPLPSAAGDLSQFFQISKGV